MGGKKANLCLKWVCLSVLESYRITSITRLTDWDQSSGELWEWTRRVKQRRHFLDSRDNDEKIGKMAFEESVGAIIDKEETEETQKHEPKDNCH